MTTEPTRRSILAVWHWPPWVVWVVLTLMIPSYFLSATPMWACVEFFWDRHRIPREFVAVTLTFYSPALSVMERPGALEGLAAWEYGLTCALLLNIYPENEKPFGPPP